ncbi:MAG: ATP-binding protein, partial [archaeon]
MEINALIKQGEGYALEFKEQISDNISKDICAFANANGGKILLGVDDDGRIKDLRDDNKKRSKIQDYARNICPALVVNVEKIGDILVVAVPEGKDKPYSVNGRFFMRQGANSQQLDRDEIRDLFRQERKLLFDERPNHKFDLDKDLNNSRFDDFLGKARISPVLGKRDVLENMQLLEEGYLRNAGVLLFCKDVKRFFLNGTINCFLYQGKDKYKILDNKEFCRDIYSNYEDAMNFLKSKLNTEFIIKGGPREEKLELPENALREALLNSLVHRDYFVNSSIHVNVYRDRVEIVNAGGLIGDVKVEDLYGKSISRNPLLFGLLQRMELVEKAGSGLLRIRDEMNKYGLDGPLILADKNFFTIRFERPDLQDRSLQEREGGQKSGQKTRVKSSEKMLSDEIKRFGEKFGESGQKSVEKVSDEEINGLGERLGERLGEKWTGKHLTKRQVVILLLIKKDKYVPITELARI